MYLAIWLGLFMAIVSIYHIMRVYPFHRHYHINIDIDWEALRIPPVIEAILLAAV